MRAAIAEIAERRDRYDFGIDGAVVRLASRRAFAAAGANTAAPRGALAWKYPAEERETVLRAVTWPVGKIGRVVPRAQVDPVFVGGTTVTYASLHNPRLVAERDIRIGDTVRIMRRGDVIPFISGSVPEHRTGDEQPIALPSACPSCGTELVVRGTGEELWCENLQCPAQAVRRLIHWASRHAADMEGVGTTWIEKLADDGVLERPSDFYALTAERLIGYERMGNTLATAMVASIDRSRRVGLRRALIGLAIPMASEGVAKRLCLAGFERLEEIADAGAEQLEAIRDIGPKVAQSISAYFARPEVRDEIAALRARRRRPRRPRRGPPGRGRRRGGHPAEGRDRRGDRGVRRPRQRRQGARARPSCACSSRRAPRRPPRSARRRRCSSPATTSARPRPTRRPSSASRSSARTRRGGGWRRRACADRDAQRVAAAQSTTAAGERSRACHVSVSIEPVCASPSAAW